MNDDIYYCVTVRPDAFQKIEVSPEIVAAVRAECGPGEDEIVWCECDDRRETLEFWDDGECDCGVHKHHYHCRACGGVVQIG